MSDQSRQFKVFVSLVHEAELVRRKSIGTGEYESKFVDVLNFIKENPSLRAQIVEEFLRMLNDTGYDSYDLIEFCLHDLKWPELLSKAVDIYAFSKHEVIKKRLFGKPLDYISRLEDLISSFGQNWQSADLYDYYDKTRKD
jgi:hypothetical protein